MGTHLMRDITQSIAEPIVAALEAKGGPSDINLSPPTREGAGDLALACHPFARIFRTAPQAIAESLLEPVLAHPLVASAEPVSGFLNLTLDWTAVAEQTVVWAQNDDGAKGVSSALEGQTVVVEYSSPNTNKPLHVGHARNNILGITVANLLEVVGANVVRVNLINDRGIHICKSMVAYRHHGEDETPESSGKKGDHLIGDYYVLFDKMFSAEYAAWCIESDTVLDKDAYFNSDHSNLGRETRNMLLAWEAKDDAVRSLWQKMNGWCEAGFQETYERMGVHFDRVYRESQTYTLGKDLVDQGLSKGVFYRADNGAAVFDLARLGLEGEKAVLRADGTSVYTTQDLGTAVQRYEELNFDRMIYVVGNEQDHHFKVLFGILAALRPELENRLVHLSYGMVELPDGKMKSREGTVIDADDLMDELQMAAAQQGRERWPELDEETLFDRAEDIAMGGLKYFLLRYAPATTFTFDRERSISIEGETGAYCQYAYARATSMLRKAGDEEGNIIADYSALNMPQSIAVLRAMLAFPGEVESAAKELKPSLVTKAIFELARSFAAFYNHPQCRVIGAEPQVRAARLGLVKGARTILGAGLTLLGLTPLDEM